MQGDTIRGHLDLLLLAILAGGPSHGYQVIRELRRRSDGILEVPEGTVYPALHRLEGFGLLDSTWSTESGRRRRVYELTPEGREVLERERSEWKVFSGAVQAVLAEV